jgi:hypothetical protein
MASQNSIFPQLCLYFQALNLTLLGFYIFKVSRIYSGIQDYQYFPEKTILTYFAAITILTSITTIVTQFMCIMNFGKGLKPYVTGDRRAQELIDQYEEEHQIEEDGI